MVWQESEDDLPSAHLDAAMPCPISLPLHLSLIRPIISRHAPLDCERSILHALTSHHASHPLTLRACSPSGDTRRPRSRLKRAATKSLMDRVWARTTTNSHTWSQGAAEEAPQAVLPAVQRRGQVPALVTPYQTLNPLHALPAVEPMVAARRIRKTKAKTKRMRTMRVPLNLSQTTRLIWLLKLRDKWNHPWN